MTDLDDLEKATRRIRAERSKDRLDETLGNYRKAVERLATMPRRFTESAAKLGISEETIDQAIRNLEEARDLNHEVKREVFEGAASLASVALNVNYNTEELANILTTYFTDRHFIEHHLPTMVAILRATTPENFKNALEALRDVDPDQYRALTDL